MKKLLTGLMAVVMMAGLAGCGSKDDGAGEGSDTAKKELTVYTNSGYKPYEMVDEKGNLYGFDIDVMNEAAKLAGYTVKWEDVDFDGIVPSVKQGKADIGIAGITYTEERAKQVDFCRRGCTELCADNEEQRYEKNRGYQRKENRYADGYHSGIHSELSAG